MYRNQRVEIPRKRGKVYERTASNGTTYVEYEFSRVYDSQRKFNIPKRTTIGKRCPDDSSSMYPNENYYKFFPDVEMIDEDETRSACLRIGA